MALVRTLAPRYAASNRLLVASFVDDAAGSTIAVTNDFHGGCVNPSSLVIDNTNPTEPGIQLTPYTSVWTGGPVYWGWAGLFSGMNGKRPKFRPTDAERHLDIAPDEIYYSYDIDGPYYPSLQGTDEGAYHEYQFADPFTQDSVYIWQQTPNTPNVMAALVSDVLASPYGHRIQADLDYTTDPTPGVIATSVPQYPTMYWGKPIPDMPVYAFRIADDTRSTAGGKRRCITMAGQHAGEWNGAAVHRRFVEWLIAAQDGGSANEQAAYDLLGHWEFLVFPMMNPLGAYAGMHRSTPETGNGQVGSYPTLDPNRTWNPAYLGSLITTAAAAAAMTQQYPDLQCNIAIDWHSRNSDNVEFFTYGDAATCPEEQALLTACRAYDSNYQPTIYPFPVADSFGGWMDSDFGSAGPFTYCPVTPVFESGIGENFSTPENLSLAAAFGRGLLDRTIAGDYPGLITGSDETHGASAIASMLTTEAWAVDFPETHAADAAASSAASESWAMGVSETHGATSSASAAASESWSLDYGESHGATSVGAFIASEGWSLGFDEVHGAGALAEMNASASYAIGNHYAESHGAAAVAAFAGVEAWSLGYSETHGASSSVGMQASESFGNEFVETHGAAAVATMAATDGYLASYRAVHAAVSLADMSATHAFFSPAAIGFVIGGRIVLNVQHVNLGSDNKALIPLARDGAPMDMSGVTRVRIEVDDQDQSIVDSDAVSISWSDVVSIDGTDYQPIQVDAAALALPPGVYRDCRVVLFDSGAQSGLVWPDPLTLVVEP